MTYDDIEKAWREGNNRQGEIHIHEDILLREIKNSQEEFNKKVFWRDAREVLAAVAVIVWFIYVGVKINAVWPFLLAAGGLWVATYIVFKRLIAKERVNTNHVLARIVEESINDVQKQIKMLDTVFYWYLLPWVPGFTLQHISFWTTTDLTKLSNVMIGVILAFFEVAVFAGAYYLNKHYAKKKLQLREKELQELRSALED
jgi:hypothetical protein